MLIHSCATGGCHQPGSRQQLQLDRWALEGNGNPLLIRRNLTSVLNQVNEDDPPSSPLIQRARQSHGAGSQASAPLASYQAAILLQWLNEAAGVEPEPPVERVAAEQPSVDEEAQPPTPVDESGATPSASPPGPQPFTPRDPFDPEIFNRRVGVQRPDHEPQQLETIPRIGFVSPAAPVTEGSASASAE
jgi:hypothetical protein